MPRQQFRLRSVFAALHRLFLSEPDPLTIWHERMRKENPGLGDAMDGRIGLYHRFAGCGDRANDRPLV